MIAAFPLFAAAGLFLLAAQHPFVTYPLSLSLMRRRKFVAPAPGAATCALCICAYNEEAIIRRKCENSIALKRVIPGLSILLYIDGASDRTAAIAREFEKEIDIYVETERHGKSCGMNRLAAQAPASILIFSDANVMIDERTLPALVAAFADPAVGCALGHLRYTNGDASATAANGSLYWRLEEKIKQLETETGSAMGADGSLFAIRKRLHHPPLDDIIDDMYVSLSILCDGYRVVRVEDATAHEQTVTSGSEEFRRKIRIACQAFNVHRLLWSRLRKLGPLDLYKYVSHKFMRWLVIYWLALALVFFEGGMVLAGWAGWGVGAAALGGFALVSGAYLRIPPLPQLADMLAAFAATGIGVWRSLMGDRFQTWALAASIRGKKETTCVRNA